MTDRDQTREESVRPRVLRTKGLFAEYNVAQRPGGEWFALGSVRSEPPLTSRAAWVLVGTGSTAEAAVGRLQVELDSAARRLHLA
jgi:hypothetical protein